MGKSRRRGVRLGKYKSTLEKKIGDVLQHGGYVYEPKESQVRYQVPHVYNPDFVHPNQPDVLIEVKGYFIKGYSDCQKYISVSRDNPQKEVVFIFSDPWKKAYAQCRPRKDGTTMSLGEWCIKNDFCFFKVGELPKGLVEGTLSTDDVRVIKIKQKDQWERTYGKRRS